MKVASLVLEGLVNELGCYPKRDKIDSDLCFIPLTVSCWNALSFNQNEPIRLNCHINLLRHLGFFLCPVLLASNVLLQHSFFGGYCSIHWNTPESQRMQCAVHLHFLSHLNCQKTDLTLVFFPVIFPPVGTVMTGNWFAGFSTSKIKPIDFKHFRAINLTFCVYYNPGHLLETQQLVC